MFGDGALTLPEGVQPPAHWPSAKLDFDDFNELWRVAENARRSPRPIRAGTSERAIAEPLAARSM
jgi:hypothetical protein